MPRRARACRLHCNPASLTSGRRCPDHRAATSVVAGPPRLFHVSDQAALSFAPTPSYDPGAGVRCRAAGVMPHHYLAGCPSRRPALALRATLGATHLPRAASLSIRSLKFFRGRWRCNSQQTESGATDLPSARIGAGYGRVTAGTREPASRFRFRQATTHERNRPALLPDMQMVRAGPRQ